MDINEIKKRIENVLLQFEKSIPKISKEYQGRELDANWMIFFKDSGEEKGLHYFIKKLVGKICLPFFKGQIAFNKATYESLEALHQSVIQTKTKIEQQEEIVQAELQNVKMQADKNTFQAFKKGQVLSLEEDTSSDIEIPDQELEAHWMIFFKGGEGRSLRSFIKKLVRKISWPLFKRQVAFNKAAYESLEALYQSAKFLHKTAQNIIKEALILTDSYTGPKARAGFWFNEPILVQYNEQGQPLWIETTERIIEKTWVLRHMSLIPTAAKVLDIGCSESLLAIELASNGFQVTGIDVRPYSLQHPNFKFVLGDICNSQLKSESYDVIIALSTIEHIGLGWYGDPCEEHSDQIAMKEIYRLLKPGGQLLITVPFGERVQTSLHRIYDSKSLHALLKGFKIEKNEYGIKVDPKTWLSPVAEEKASLQKHNPVSGSPSAVAMVLCRKPLTN